jgi:hypothetical protein
VLGTQDVTNTPDSGGTRVSLALTGNELVTGGPMLFYQVIMLPRAYSDGELQSVTT